MVQPPEPEPATPPVPPGYPARWEFDAVLTDGGTVHIRPVVPADAEAIDAFHVRQSRETIYFRYFSPLPRLSARDLDRIVNIDYLTHMGLVALLGDEVVGLASYDMWPDHNEAEVAFIVDDAHQGRGLATVLLEYLAVAARENGLDGLTATVLPTNRKMLGVFHDAGFQVASAFEEGVIEVRLGIEPTEEGRLVIEDRERRSEAASVTRLLSPASIAVIGAGRERGGIGHEVFRNLVAGGFDGPVYPVNPAGGHVASVRAYQSVLDIPDAVDLAVVAVPAGGVLDVVEECGRKRVRGLVIFSAGFDRLPEGTEERIVERAHATGMRVIGPESMGVINTAPGVSLIASFGEVAVRPGNVGFLTQSGTLGLAALDHAHRLGVGFSTFVDVGSKIDVSGNDLLQFWATDERTTVVALHLQSFGNPRKFTRIVRDLARAKPVVAVKSGRARPGAGEAKRMGESWSAGDLTDAATDAMLAQSGVIRVETPTQLFDAARVLSSQPVPAGRRVAIVSNARGASVLAVDACIGAGLETPEPSAATVAALAGRLPEGARLSNPFELTWEAGPDAFRAAVSAALADDAFDSVVVLYAPPVQPRPAEVAAAVGDAMAGADKPVIATFLGSEPGDEVDGVRPGVPLFRFPSEGARTLGRLAAYGEWLSRPAGTLPSAEELGLDVAAVQARVAELLVADPEGRRLEHAEAADLLALAGLPACPTVMVVGPDEAVAAAHGVPRRAEGEWCRALPPGRGRRCRARPARRRRPAGGLRPDGDHPALGHGPGHRAEGGAVRRRCARGRPAAPGVRRCRHRRARWRGGRGQQRPTGAGAPALRHRCRRAGGRLAGGWPVGRGGGRRGPLGGHRRALPPPGPLRRPARAGTRARRGGGQPGDRRPRRRGDHRRLGARGPLPVAHCAGGPSARLGARAVPRSLTPWRPCRTTSPSHPRSPSPTSTRRCATPCPTPRLS
jgi:acyl-CoA synthetase (NDP forming)/GNAT superfamily N-acetyltransferase